MRTLKTRSTLSIKTIRIVEPHSARLFRQECALQRLASSRLKGLEASKQLQKSKVWVGLEIKQLKDLPKPDLVQLTHCINKVTHTDAVKKFSQGLE